MVENHFGGACLIHQFKMSNRKNAGFPIHDTPCLNNSLSRHEFELASDDMSAKDAEGTEPRELDLLLAVALPRRRRLAQGDHPRQVVAVDRGVVQFVCLAGGPPVPVLPAGPGPVPLPHLRLWLSERGQAGDKSLTCCQPAVAGMRIKAGAHAMQPDARTAPGCIFCRTEFIPFGVQRNSFRWRAF